MTTIKVHKPYHFVGLEAWPTCHPIYPELPYVELWEEFA